MATRLHRATVLALYQLSLAVGIALLPVALAASRVGVPIPFDRILTRLVEAYEDA